MSETLKLVLDYIDSDNPWIILLVLLLLLAIFFPGKFTWLRSLSAYLISFASAGARKFRQKRKILDTLNPSIKALREDSGIASFTDLPDVDIRYQEKTSDTTSMFEEGKITVFLSDSREQRSANIAKATLAYVNKGMYSSVRPYMSRTCSEALDLTLARAVVEKDQEALAYLSRYVVNKVLTENEEIRDYYRQFNLADRAGLLHSLLLHQLTLLSERSTAYAYDPALLAEIKDFIEYVAQFADRDRQQNIPLYFYRNYIKVGIFLLGRDETLERGLNPYFVHLKRYVLGEYTGCYVLAAGRKIDIIEHFREAIASNGYFQPRVRTEGSQIRVINLRRKNEEYSKAALVYFPIRRFAGEPND